MPEGRYHHRQRVVLAFAFLCHQTVPVARSIARIRTVRRGFPRAQLDVLVFRGGERILKGNPDVDGVRTMPERPSIGETIAAVGDLWRRYDLVVSTQAGDRPTVFSMIAARRRVEAFAFGTRLTRITRELAGRHAAAAVAPAGRAVVDFSGGTRTRPAPAAPNPDPGPRCGRRAVVSVPPPGPALGGPDHVAPPPPPRAPWSAGAAAAAPSSVAAVPAAAASPAASSGRPSPAVRSARIRAWPMPHADSTLA